MGAGMREEGLMEDEVEDEVDPSQAESEEEREEEREEGLMQEPGDPSEAGTPLNPVDAHPQRHECQTSP